jgi:formate hydrogenlyase subunit 4
MTINTELILAVAFQLTQLLLVVLAAPLLSGWVNQCQAWLQNRSGAGVLQPYRVLHKLFLKDAVIAHNASWLFRMTPYIVFGCMWLAAAIIPIIAVDLPFSRVADVIALVGVFALARMFIAFSGRKARDAGVLSVRTRAVDGIVHRFDDQSFHTTDAHRCRIRPSPFCAVSQSGIRRVGISDGVARRECAHSGG